MPYSKRKISNEQQDEAHKNAKVVLVEHNWDESNEDAVFSRFYQNDKKIELKLFQNTSSMFPERHQVEWKKMVWFAMGQKEWNPRKKSEL